MCVALTGPVQVCLPHPAVVQVDQPARHAQEYDAAAAIPAQAALRPGAMLRYVMEDGVSKIAARHILRPGMSLTKVRVQCHKNCCFGACQRKQAQMHALRWRVQQGPSHLADKDHLHAASWRTWFHGS